MPRKPATREGWQVVSEEMHSQFRAFGEALESLRGELNARFDETDRRNDVRFTALEAAVRQNSADIRQNSADIRQNSADIRQNSADIRQNTSDIRKNGEDIRSLEARAEEQVAATRELVLRVEANTSEIRALGERVGRLDKLEERVEALERGR